MPRSARRGPLPSREVAFESELSEKFEKTYEHGCAAAAEMTTRSIEATWVPLCQQLHKSSVSTSVFGHVVRQSHKRVRDKSVHPDDKCTADTWAVTSIGTVSWFALWSVRGTLWVACVACARGTRNVGHFVDVLVGETIRNQLQARQPQGNK